MAIISIAVTLSSMLSAGAFSVIPNALRTNSVVATIGLHPAFTCPSSLPLSCLKLSSDETANLLEKASRLRKEAEALEVTMLSSREAAKEKKTNEAVKAQKTYTSFKNSTWLISYRFASDAVNRDGDDDDDDEVKLSYYSGKVTLTLTEDGYTNVDNSDGSKEESSSGLKFEKFWGWDEESAEEDDLQYVLFSADVLLPESDPNIEKKSIRYYFQAQVDTDAKSNEITLSGGTVTLKKDIKPPGGLWGVFNGVGILAQFRYCGEFLMKPC